MGNATLSKKLQAIFHHIPSHYFRSHSNTFFTTFHHIAITFYLIFSVMSGKVLVAHSGQVAWILVKSITVPAGASFIC